jgi:hypothetical protein
MSALQQLQSDFQRYVLGAGEVGAGLAAAVREQAGLPARARLAIYHNAYRARLREALSAAFEHTWGYVGDAMFAELADNYAHAHPSPFRNLRWFGGDFAAHAARAMPDYPFDAAPLRAADLAALAPQDWGAMAFALHPSVQLLALRWNTVALWQALAAQRTPPEAEEAAAPACWLVWRSDNQPHFRSLDALEAQALRGIGQGATFGAVCLAAAAGDADADATPRLAGYLQAWLAQGVLALPTA